MIAIYINGHLAYTGFDTHEDAERFTERTLTIDASDSVEIR